MLIRNDTRKASERRRQDRRQVDYDFGSAQWIEHIKNHYAAWPKTERRQQNRRSGERRQCQSDNESLSDYKSSRLTEEEEIFFDNLFKAQD